MKLRIFVAMLVMVFSLLFSTSCNPKEGQVVRKIHKHESTLTVFFYHPVAGRKILKVNTFKVPETWLIEIDPGVLVNLRCHVSKEEFNKIKLFTLFHCKDPE